MLNINEHKFILVSLLKQIYSDVTISPLLGLKGGTAVYLFYNLSRFSVDLDFNLFDFKKEKFVLDKIESMAKKFGSIKDKSKKRYTLFLLFSYKKEAQNVKIEISRRRFPDHYEVKNYLGIPMLVMTKEDLFAHKLVALLERRKIANRDLFDLWFFMKNKWSINQELVELRTKMELKNYFQKCIEKVETIQKRNILQGLGELVDERQKIWVKNKLKDELLFLLKFYMQEENKN